MKKWEYHWIKTKGRSDAELGDQELFELGDQGWELVNVVPVETTSDGAITSVLWVFKRPLAEKDETS